MFPLGRKEVNYLRRYSLQVRGDRDLVRSESSRQRAFQVRLHGVG